MTKKQDKITDAELEMVLLLDGIQGLCEMVHTCINYSDRVESAYLENLIKEIGHKQSDLYNQANKFIEARRGVQ